MPKRKAPSLETTMDSLTSIIETLETPGVSMEDSLTAFETGVKLSRTAQQKLVEAEQVVRTLTELPGEIELQDIHTEES